MNRKLLHVATAAGLLGLAACKENTSPSATPLFNDATVTADVAASAGDAIATGVGAMIGNEGFAALPAPGASFDLLKVNGDSFTFSRTRTCYDSTGALVAGCMPMSAVREVVVHFSIDGSRNGSFSTTGGDTVTFSGAVHRVADDTMLRVFTGTTETSRVHNGFGTSHDTTAFASDSISRHHDEAASDSVVAVTWNLPRFANPWPVSGKIIRNIALHTTFTSPTRSETRDVTRRVEVDFPPDAQGNVTLQINSKTCTLNLVTHRVFDCH